MIEPILYGLSAGIVFSLMLGAVFFLLIQNSIDYGYKSGYFIAAGVLVSDLIYILFAILGTKFLPNIPNFDLIISIIGFILLFALGIVNLFNKSPKIFYPETKAGSYLSYFSKGFFINMLNPVNFFFWVGVAGAMRKQHYSNNQMYLFFASCQFSIFATQVLVAYTAHRLKKFIDPQKIILINRVVGFLFIFFAFKLIYNYFFS